MPSSRGCVAGFLIRDEGNMVNLKNRIRLMLFDVQNDEISIVASFRDDLDSDVQVRHPVHVSRLDPIPERVFEGGKGGLGRTHLFDTEY